MVYLSEQLKQRQPVSSGDFDVPLWISQGNNTYICLADGNKNIRQLKNTSGTTVATYDYDPFGKASGSGTVTQPWQFSSEYFDTETGLVYYNYRYYSPELGRWTRRDPIEEEGGYNLYVMVGNNVVNRWDNLGNADSFGARQKAKGGQEYVNRLRPQRPIPLRLYVKQAKQNRVGNLIDLFETVVTGLINLRTVNQLEQAERACWSRCKPGVHFSHHRPRHTQ